MITEKHYTDKNEHPEDRIYNVKKFINELSNVQDYYFNQLLLDLNLNDDANDYLFDFIFNEGENNDGFEDYLLKFNKSYKDFFLEK
jgi:hypothetical protein